MYISILRLLAHAVKLGPSDFLLIFGIIRFSWESRSGSLPVLFLRGLLLLSPPLSLGGEGGGPLSLVGGGGSSPSGFGLGGVAGGSAGFLPSRLDTTPPVPLMSGVFKR